MPEEALDTDINLDFARATLALAPRLRAQKQTERLKSLAKKALDDIAVANELKKANAAMIEAMQGQSSINNFEDLEELETGLKALAPA